MTYRTDLIGANTSPNGMNLVSVLLTIIARRESRQTALTDADILTIYLGGTHCRVLFAANRALLKSRIALFAILFCLHVISCFQGLTVLTSDYLFGFDSSCNCLEPFSTQLSIVL